ncbi:MAG: PQQ-dependent sugar dehydrogenase, partial [Leptospiraceae bacterium]|nr:PQQ-dependent sugar dehydrogenase [Leptospiraceae bacterium]
AGLLGFAFHPKFLQNGLFYANYVVRENGKDYTFITEFLSKSKNFSENLKSPLKVLLKIEQPYPNHNAGQLAFGNDGLLYIGFGDGGSGGDPHGHGQNTKTMLGSMIRIDVDKNEKHKLYKIPKDNPFANDKEFLPEIFAYGLRNPWRYSFDKSTGRLFLADVGQNEYEEINIIEKGKNYGWNIREGFHCYKKNPKCNEKFAEPIHEYSHSEGQSITGGYVYRGKEIPELYGGYVYGDFVSGKVWVLFTEKSRKINNFKLFKANFPISTFGQNSKGEIYFSDFAKGEIYYLIK